MKYESSWTQPGEGFLKELELDEVVVDKKGKVVKDWGSHPSLDGAKKDGKESGYH